MQIKDSTILDEEGRKEGQVEVIDYSKHVYIYT